MAIDTRNKRASCLLLGMPFGRVYPNPDASLANQADRQHENRLYAVALAVVVISLFPGLTTSIRLTRVGQA